MDYVRVAYEGGAAVYGISDHAPIPDGSFSEVRMALDELDSYEKAVHLAQAKFPEIEVLLGMECEYFPHFNTCKLEKRCGTINFFVVKVFVFSQ